jgi:hypothetical protein
VTRKDEGEWSEKMFGGGRACRWFEELLCCFAPAARRPDEVLLVPKLRALRDRGKLNQLLGLDLREPRLHFATRRSHAPLLSHKDYTTTRGPSQGISNRSSHFFDSTQQLSLHYSFSIAITSKPLVARGQRKSGYWYPCDYLAGEHRQKYLQQAIYI